ncbi:MAG: hypothetical protein JWP91_181 [Fibrobacteres bacterium]|nr:hypothetical protein [Fibrobacterota bacterium]
MIPRLPKGFSHPMTVGEGSFSSVYRVRQKILDRWVAVKILNEKNGERRQELLTEARNQAQMSISCIPAVYDAFSQGQQIFIVMEWIKGASLHAILEKGIPHPADRAALAASMIAALAGLHKLGYAHRDFKPANILISRDSGVYLVDFGFSKKVGEGGQSMIGTVKGTPAYMAPEIWQGRPEIDFMKADLYALGKVLLEVAPGPDWDRLIHSLVSANPGDRPASAVELWDMFNAHPMAAQTPDWKALITRVSSEILSRQLLQAAKQLLFAKRGEEAYWLLAECLSEDPDSAEAFRLLDGFPSQAREKGRKRWSMAAAAAAALALALSAGFHFGKRLERESWFPAVSPEGEAALLLLPSQGSGTRTARSAAQFREFKRTDGRLAGLLFLEGADACESLTLDARTLGRPLPSEGIPMESGEHSLACGNRDGTLIHREKIDILPFQRKIIRLRKNARKGEA